MSGLAPLCGELVHWTLGPAAGDVPVGAIAWSRGEQSPSYELGSGPSGSAARLVVVAVDGTGERQYDLPPTTSGIRRLP